MRTLKFIVDKQILNRDQNCDFSDLVPGTEEYLQLEFSFSSEWTGYTKVVGFWSLFGKEYPAMVLKDGRTCIVPAEALKRRAFRIQVVGKRGNERINTNKIQIDQNGGGL